jgi:hypothetical protein
MKMKIKSVLTEMFVGKSGRSAQWGRVDAGEEEADDLSGNGGGETGGNVVGSGNEDAVAKRNAIANHADQSREEEFADVNDDDTTAPFQAEVDPDEVVGEVDANGDPVVAEPEEVAAAEVSPPEVKKIKIKVNGKELELTQEELIERAQKVESADDYLRRAKESAKPAVETKPPVNAEDQKRRQDEEDSALVRALQMGTTEEATAAIRKIREQSSARPSMNSDDVSRTIDERLAYKDAVAKFSTEYSDIMSDPVLRDLAGKRDDELMKAGDDRDYFTRYAAIGEDLRAWMKSKSTATETPETETKPAVTTLEEKRAKKQAAQKVPVVANAKNAPPEPDQDVDDTPSAVIASMAKARGGPQWMRN